MRPTHAEFCLNHTFFKCLVILVASFLLGSRLNDITYSIKNNGIMVNIDFTEPISDDDIIGWKSDRGWVYLTLLGVASPKEKIPKKAFNNGIKKIVIDDFDESIQLAFLIQKPIIGYDIINSEFSSSAILFIHTGMNNYKLSSGKKYFKDDIESVFAHDDNSTFPKYNTNFKNAFDKARNELGPNSIFKFKGKLYTTNHPGEEKENNPALIKKSNSSNIKFNNEIFTESKIEEDSIKNLSNNQRYSFFKDKYVLDNKGKVNENLTENDDLVEFLYEENHKDKNVNPHLYEKNSKGKIENNSNENIEKKSFFTQLNKNLFKSDVDENDKKVSEKSNADDWLNDKFPKNKQTYSGYHPNWSFPDDREALEYSHNDFNEFEKPESFPKRISDPIFMQYYHGGIKVNSNLNGIPIYIDGKYIGETPINKPIQVEPGWHQVSGFSPVYNRLNSKNILQFVNLDPIINNNELYGSETTYVESGKVETVSLRFNQMGDTPKKWKEINGGMLIGAPIISLIFGLIAWGIA